MFLVVRLVCSRDVLLLHTNSVYWHSLCLSAAESFSVAPRNLARNKQCSLSLLSNSFLSFMWQTGVPPCCHNLFSVPAVCLMFAWKFSCSPCVLLCPCRSMRDRVFCVRTRAMNQLFLAMSQSDFLSVHFVSSSQSSCHFVPDSKIFFVAAVYLFGVCRNLLVANAVCCLLFALGFSCPHGVALHLLFVLCFSFVLFLCCSHAFVIATGFSGLCARAAVYLCVVTCS